MPDDFVQNSTKRLRLRVAGVAPGVDAVCRG